MYRAVVRICKLAPGDTGELYKGSCVKNGLDPVQKSSWDDELDKANFNRRRMRRRIL